MKYLLLIENCLGLIFGFVFLMNFGIVFYSLYLEILIVCVNLFVWNEVFYGF